MSQQYLFEIFEKQSALLEKFHAIELKNLPDTFQPTSGTHVFAPEDFQSYGGQRRIRELLWRIFEESIETLEAIKEWRQEDAVEEVADIFHFLIEFFIVIGHKPTSFPCDSHPEPLSAVFGFFDDMPASKSDSPETNWVDFLIQVGLLANSLKNRPWKKTLTDVEVAAFMAQARQLMIGFVCAAHRIGLRADTLYNAYMHKNEVNKTRIAQGV